MTKSGLEKIFLKSHHVQSLRKSVLLPKQLDFAQNYKFSNKDDLLCAMRMQGFKKIFVVDIDMINETLKPTFHPYSIFTG